jgi:hypothetical protein
MNDELSKNPIVHRTLPGRLTMKLKKDRLILEIVAPKGWKLAERLRFMKFHIDAPIDDTPESKKNVGDIFRNFIEVLEKE